MGKIDVKSNLPFRDASLDVIAGILVIRMMLGHCAQKVDYTDSFIYDAMNYLSFFMPWFFFKGGMFWHHCSMKKVVLGGVRRLMVPYAIFTIVGHFLTCAQMLYHSDAQYSQYIWVPIKEMLLNGSISGNLPLWFLLSLFVVRIIVNLIGKNNKRISFLMIFSISMGFFLYFIDFEMPLYIANVATGMFFYCAGYFMKDIQYNKIIAFSAIILYLLFCCYGLTIVDMRANKLIAGMYVLYPISSLAGIIAIDNIIKALPVKLFFFESIGSESMFYYVTHWIVICFTLSLFHILDLPAEGGCAFLLVTTILACILSLSNLGMKKFNITI